MVRGGFFFNRSISLKAFIGVLPVTLDVTIQRKIPKHLKGFELSVVDNDDLNAS